MHRDTQIYSGQNRYGVMIVDYVEWRWWVGEVTENALHFIGHPCCGRGIGRVRPIGWLAYRLLQWGETVRSNKRIEVADTAITEDQYRDLGVWDDLDEFIKQDRERDDD